MSSSEVPRPFGQDAKEVERAENALSVSVVDHEVMHLIRQHLRRSCLDCCSPFDAVWGSAHELLHRCAIRPVVGEIGGRDDPDDAISLDHGQCVKVHHRKQISRSSSTVRGVDRHRAPGHEIVDDDWLFAVGHVLIEHRSCLEEQSPSSRLDQAGTEVFAAKAKKPSRYTCADRLASVGSLPVSMFREMGSR